MSSFSKDKFPTSFSNEIISISANLIVIRSNVKNLEDCNNWVKEYGKLTNTKWNTRLSKPCGERMVCLKKFVCHHSSFNKVPAEANKQGVSKNFCCRATVIIKVKLNTPATRRYDSFIKKGLFAIITINDVHNHDLDTAEALKFLPPADCKETFLKYFNDGMGVAEARKHHNRILQLNGKLTEKDMANSQINPPCRTVRYWYDRWRLRNSNPKTGQDLIEDSNSENPSLCEIKSEPLNPPDEECLNESNSIENCSEIEINSEFLDAVDRKDFKLDPLIIVDNVEVDEESLPEESYYFENTNNSNSQVISEKEDQMANKSASKDIGAAGNTAENNGKVILRRSSRIQEKKRLLEWKQKIAEENVSENNPKSAKKKSREKNVKKKKNDSSSLQNSKKISRPPVTGISCNIPESVVRISNEGGKTVVGFKMVDKEELVDISEDNLTPLMKTLLYNYYDRNAQRLRYSVISSETETSVEDDAISAETGIPFKKLEKKSIQDYHAQQLFYFNNSDHFKGTACKLETKILI